MSIALLLTIALGAAQDLPLDLAGEVGRDHSSRGAGLDTRGALVHTGGDELAGGLDRDANVQGDQLNLVWYDGGTAIWHREQP